jgi:large subunit ribosomal protein L4
MKHQVNSLDNKSVKDIDLEKDIFGVPYREDIIYRMIRYQAAKKQSGNHKTKGISEISGTTKKPFKQKGTGSARQGSKRSPQMRGGAVIFGPQVRSHAHKLPKKIKNLALKIALSKKLSDGKLKVVSDIKLAKSKTSLLKNKLKTLGVDSVLFVTGKDIDNNFLLASRNIPNIDFLPFQGINVYTIVKRDFLILSQDAVDLLNERFSK